MPSSAGKYISIIAFLQILFTIPLSGFCQDNKTTILVKDHENLPLINAVVMLFRLPDSTEISNLTDKSGVAHFQKLIPALYSVKIEYLGFQAFEETILIKSEGNSFEFELKQEILALGEVTISSERPLLRYEDDKMIIDPMPLINTSTNTLEILEKTPGLFVDQDGGIFISSSAPAAIYINGREQKMSSQDISNLLRSLPPGSVERIEVMRSPSTKYDASSSGGIINIVLKKGTRIGRFGSISAGMNQGFYGNQFGEFSINNSSDESTSYINLNYSRNDRLDELNSSRILDAGTTLTQSANTRKTNHQGYLGYGINFDVWKKANISYDGRISLSIPKTSSHNNNIIQSIEELIISENNNNTIANSDFLSIQQDIGLVQEFDTLGSNLDTKISYSYNGKNEYQEYSDGYIFPLYALLSGEGKNIQQRHYILLQSDLTYQFHRKIKLETGIRGTYQSFDNSADFTIDFNGNQLSDPLRTSAFSYLENINAIYAQVSKTWGKSFVLKTGIRIEQTYMNGHQTVPADTSFLITRIDLFPYIYLSRRLFGIAGTDIRAFLIYRRTIKRPDYENLNPYMQYLDQFLYETGNPALRPQFTDNIEANVSFDDFPIFAIGQNYTRDIFANVVYQHPDLEDVAVRTYDNLGKNTETYFRIVVGIPPGKTYFFAAGAQYNHNKYDGYYEGEPFSYSKGGWRIFTFQSLRLFKQTKLSLNGFIMINGQYNFYELGTFGQLNIGLTQTLFKKKITISINARDILRTMTTKFTLDQGSIYSYGERYTDNQRFGINLRYDFGINRKEDRQKNFPFNFDDNN